MSTRNIVPRADGEGSLGTTLKRWLSGFFNWIDIKEYIDLDSTENPSHQEGRIFYDNCEHALSIYNDSLEVTHNLGQEILVRVNNSTGVDIENGKCVHITGSNGANCPTIALSQANTEATSHFLGMTTSIIPNGGYGYVTSLGKVHNVDTSSFEDGDTLYLSAEEAGGVTNSKPALAVIIGYVILASSGGAGIIYICGNELGAIGADMLKSIYDTNDNGIVDNSEKLNGYEFDIPSSGDIDNNKIYTYNSTLSKFILEKKGIAYSAYTSDETESTTTDQVNWQQKLRLSFTPEKTGNYMLSWTAEISSSGANKGVIVQVELDDTTQLNISLNAPAVANSWETVTGFKSIALENLNTHTIDVDFKAETTATAKIRRVRIEIRKIA